MLILGLLAAAPAYGLRSIEEVGRFDANMLRVDEAQHLGGMVADVPVTTATGTQTLTTLADGKPLILALVYYGCGHSCPVTLRHLAGLELPDDDEFQVMAVSFDQDDTLQTMAAARQSGSTGKKAC